MAVAMLLVLATAAVLGCAKGSHGSTTDPNDLASQNALAACPAGTAIFTVPPVGLSELSGWVPLGNLNPPGHTFPTDHQYLYHTNPDARPVVLRAVQVVSPGAVTIIGARRSQYSTGNTDYTITFMPCAQVRAEFGHVNSITSELLTQLGAFDQFCDSYSPSPGLTVTMCATRTTAVKVPAGAVIGSAGGVPNVFGLDFSTWDSRITPHTFANPSRWTQNSSGFDSFHIVAASDYFAEPARTQIAAKLGAFDGSRQRTAAPVGGTIELDVPGTAQGHWFNPTQPTHPETPHLAIGPDNVDPAQITVSLGMSQPNFPSGQYRIGSPSGSTVNRHPAQIAADGSVHCYTTTNGSVLLLQLVDAATLRVEGRSGNASCGAGPYTFTAGATFDYKR